LWSYDTGDTGRQAVLLPVGRRRELLYVAHVVGNEDEALAAFTAFQARAEADAGRKIGTLRTDRGGEFMARSFADHYTKQGMQRHLTAPYTPEQNEVVERKNQSVKGMTHSMMKAMSMPSWFWGEAVLTAVFILNRSPTQSVEGRTPYEVWHGKKPSIDYFHTFGCVAHVKQGNKRLSKLEDRSTMMVFIGYEPGSKAWRFYNPVTRHVHVSHDAVFEEDHAWSWNEDEIGDDESFQVEYIAVGGAHPAVGDNAWPDSPLVTPQQILWQSLHQGAWQCPCAGLSHAHLPFRRRSEWSSTLHHRLTHPISTKRQMVLHCVLERWLTCWAHRLGGMHMIHSAGKSCWQQSVMSQSLLKKH
jgi:transposase InsO family protein